MSRFCPITGKSTSTWNNVSHSKRRTKRTWKVNMIKKKLMNSYTWASKKTRISAKWLRILTKDLFSQADQMFNEIMAKKKS